MSRIYDALKQTENSVVRMIEGEQVGQPAPSDHIEAVVTAEPENLEAPLPEAETEDIPFAEQSSINAAPVSEYGYRIVKVRARATSPVLPFDGSDRRTAECYRILRTNFLHHPARPKMIAVSSAGSGDGKTTSSINFAGVLALKQDVQVLLVDADLRHGSVAPRLGIDASPGLAEVLTGQCSLEDAIIQTENLANLHVLPAGRTSTNPVELLDSAAWRGMAQDLRGRFQFVIVDTTPIGIVADYDLVQVVCDGTMVVVRPDHTDRQACMKALQSIPKDKLLGVLLNSTPDWFLWRSRDYYGYYGNSPQPSKS